MATWTDFATLLASLAAGKAFTDEKAQALAENPIALAEGAAGASRIYIGALQRITAGSQIRSRIDTVQTTASTSAVTALEFGFLQVGSVRVTLEHEVAAGTSEASVVRVRNGSSSTIGTWTTSGGYVARSVDVDVLPGDLVRITHRQAVSGNVRIRNVRIQTNGEDLWPGQPGPLEGNTYT